MMTFVDANGAESLASSAASQWRSPLRLPPATARFCWRTCRRLPHRTPHGGCIAVRATGQHYVFVAQIDNSAVTYVDVGATPAVVTTLDTSLAERRLGRLGRPSWRSNPGTVVKMEGSRFELTNGGQLIAEGREGRET